MRHHFRFRHAKEDAGDGCDMVAKSCFHGPWSWENEVRPFAEWDDKWKCGRCGYVNLKDRYDCCYCQAVRTDD